MTTKELFDSWGKFCIELEDTATKAGLTIDTTTVEIMATLFLARELASLRELLASTITTDSSKNQAVRTTKVTR